MAVPFTPKKEIPTHNLRRAVIANAVASSTYTIAQGTAVQPGATGHNTFVTLSGASNPVLGVVIALEFNGKIVEVNSITGINSASTGLNTSAGVYTDNETTGAWKAVYIPSNLTIDYTVDLDDPRGTTTDSGGFGWFNLIAAATGTAAGTTLDESTVALFGGTQGQFWSNGADLDIIGDTKAVQGHWSKVL